MLRKLSAAIGCASLLGAGPGCQPAPPSPPSRPNVLLIVLDTVSADRLGAYGARRDTSPVLDGLARKGVVFRRAYASAPWTKPSVASILTGLHPATHGANAVDKLLPAEVDTLPEILAARGYGTAGIVSHVVLRRSNGFGQGFEKYDESDAWKDHDHISTEGVTSGAIEALERLASRDEPFFLFVHYFDPHYNYQDHPEVDFARPRAGRLDGTQSIGELRRMGLRREEIHYLQARHEEEIRHTDAGIGRLLERLGALGLDQETIVVVTSDHGEEFLERGWLGHTRTLYEELIRVPLVVRVPWAPARVVAQPVSLVSLAATVLELVGAEAHPAAANFQGRSLAPLILGEVEELDASPYVFAEVDFVPLYFPPKRSFKKAIVGPRFKLIRDDETGVLELYDLEKDPGEKRNLAARDPEQTRHLSALLNDHLRRARDRAVDHRDQELTPEYIEKLRALGYVEETPPD